MSDSPSLSEVIERNRRAARPSLVVYLTGGLPDEATTPRLVEAVAAAGADAVELGIPFSDPIMDGPTIQLASQRALDRGATPAGILRAVRYVSGVLPIGFMTYANVVGHAGWRRFAAMAAEAGLTAAIIPDLPLEEAGPWLAAAESNGIETVLFAAPTSPDDRIVANAERTRGFLYAVGTMGVTGERAQLATSAGALCTRAKRLTDKPVLVGVGVSDPAQAREAVQTADGVIVGSAVVRRVLEASSPQAAVGAVGEFVAELRAGLDEVAVDSSIRSGAADPGCDLCEAAPITPRLLQDGLCWVADCEACGVPMVVWRHHGLPLPADEGAMLARLARVADGRYGDGEWVLDPVRRQIPDHWHAHARPRLRF